MEQPCGKWSVRANENVTGARVLIVDDQEANVRLLERILRRAGYATFATTTEPRLALALYLEFQPDIVLLDLRMKALDGFEVLEQLQDRIPAEVCMPIVVMSADTSPDARRRALSLGASRFLPKPLDLSQVQRLVGELLQARAEHLERGETAKLSVGATSPAPLREPFPPGRADDMGQVAREVAHDLSNLISVIRNYAAFVVSAMDQQMTSAIPSAWAEIRRDAEEICVAAERSEALTARLLAAGYEELGQVSTPR